MIDVSLGILTTALAPRQRALTICPDDEIPPSAMHGTPYLRAILDVLYMALAWALPTAHTSCVVHIDPDPIPILMPSTPA